MKKGFFLSAIMIAGLSACTTPQSIGTSNFMSAWRVCEKTEYKFAQCMNQSPNSRYYSNAERELVAYFGLIMEKERRGEISAAEARYYLTSYMRKAKDISDQAEEAQAAAIGGAIGATVGTAAYIHDRRCRAAGTC